MHSLNNQNEAKESVVKSNISALIVSFAVTVAGYPAIDLAATHKPPSAQNSPDIISPQAAPAAAALSTSASVTAATVGDPDSFGRNVVYLGLAQMIKDVFLVSSAYGLCTDPTFIDPTLTTCIQLSPPPNSGSFNYPNLASISLPANASHSVLCFAFTPFVQYQFSNPGSTSAVSAASGSASFTILNPLLNDPSLIDPTTGVAFGGKISSSIGTGSESYTLAPGAVDSKFLEVSRSCINGFVSRQSLVSTYGLTAAQAKAFFTKPMVIQFGAFGSVQSADFLDYFWGIRLYGDTRLSGD
jgi:hypothetical protein